MFLESTMTVHGKRSSRVITSKSWSAGNKKSFTEYLSPAEEKKEIKMLKLEKQLWIYSPSTDRTIQISGHMLRQSVMGSDLSYEDMMDDRKLTDIYSAKVTGNEKIGDRNTWVLSLTAKVEDVAYFAFTEDLGGPGTLYPVEAGALREKRTAAETDGAEGCDQGGGPLVPDDCYL